MRLMHLSDKEWTDLKASLEAGSALAGAFMVLGPSEEIAVHAQSLLKDTSLRGYHVRYFLCSGSGVFRVPCCNSFADSQVVPEPIDGFHLLEGHLAPGVSAPQQVVSELEQTMVGETGTPQLVLIEFITPPAKHDLLFTLLLLRSALLRHIPVLMFVHQQGVSKPLQRLQHDAADEILSMLYLCGGRLREAEWHTIIGQSVENTICDRLIASRHIGSAQWFCYASRGVAEMAKGIFSGMNQEKKRNLARRVLLALPNGTGYPLLAIASETDDLNAMLSKYSSRDAINMALSEPEQVVRYFDRLQLAARAAGDLTLGGIANANYLASLLYVDRTNAIQIYQELQRAPLSNVDAKVESLFWFVLGQSLALMENAQAWEYASDCFRLDRECLKNAGKMSREEMAWGLATIANGEALIAFKLQQGEKALWLEESALAELKDVDSSLYFQIHMRTNLGDVFLRLFGDVTAAIVQYEAALLASSRVRKRPKRHRAPEKDDAFGQRAAQKLGNALMQAARYEEAILVFEALLDRLKRASNKRGEMYATIVLKARLALAQAHLKAGHQRSAAACYWRILRQPDWLEPETLKDVGSKLQCCRPEVQKPLQKRLDRIVSAQEEMMVGVMNAQKVLSGMT